MYSFYKPNTDGNMRKSEVKLGSAVDFTLDITEEDISQLSASIMSPTGNDVPCLLKTQADSHLGEPSIHVHTAAAG